MILKYTIKQVFGFIVLAENTVAYISEDRLFVIKNQTQLDIKVPSKSRVFYAIDKFLFVSDIENFRTIVYDCEDNFSFSFVNYLSSMPLAIEDRRIDKYVFPNARFKEKGQFLGKLNINDLYNSNITTYPINYGLNGAWLILSEKCFLSHKDGLLACEYFETGLSKWQTDFTEFGTWYDYDGSKRNGSVTRIYRISNEIVVVELSQKGIAGVSAETGEILWQVNKDVEPVEPTLYNGVFYGFAEFYYEIDGVTGKLLRQQSYKEIFAQNNFRDYRLTRPCITEDLIAITSHYDNAILLLDKATLNVIQRIQIEGSKNGLSLTDTPQIHGNSLYQLDGDNTLHIFDIGTVLK